LDVGRAGEVDTLAGTLVTDVAAGPGAVVVANGAGALGNMFGALSPAAGRI